MSEKIRNALMGPFAPGYDWRSNMDVQGGIPTGGYAPLNVLREGPPATGSERVYNALRPHLPEGMAFDRLAGGVAPVAAAFTTDMYDVGADYARTGQPAMLAMSLLPGMKPAAKAAQTGAKAVENALARSIRLYRGEGGKADITGNVDWSGGIGDAARGNWFTTSLDEAKNTYAGSDGLVYYVDIPEDKLKELTTSTLFPGEHYVLPDALTATKSLLRAMP